METLSGRGAGNVFTAFAMRREREATPEHKETTR
jgi:hypothetical protein